MEWERGVLINDKIELNKKLKKVVNNFFNINVDKLEFITKVGYGRGYICLIYEYGGKKIGIVITDKDTITFCELIPGDVNSPIVATCGNEILPLTFNMRSGMVIAEYNKNETKVSAMNCNPKMPNYGNREYTYDGKMFDADKMLIVSKLEGF